MEKELALVKAQCAEFKSKYSTSAAALKESLSDNRRLREEMGRHGNSLTMLSQSQPKRKNQDSDPDQSIKSSKH